MIKVFYGDDRPRAQAAIIKWLGTDYEVIEGSSLTSDDLPTLFFGTSLFASERAIMVRDLLANRALSDHLLECTTTPHRVALWESKVDKRTTLSKDLARAGVEFTEFKLPEQQDPRAVFDIYRTAKRDGARAVKMLAEFKSLEDPVQFMGLLTSQAIKDLSARPTGTREKRVLKELSATDIQMKTTAVEPWHLVESFLLRLSTF